MSAYLAGHALAVLNAEQLETGATIAHQVEVLLHAAGPRARALHTNVEGEVLVVGGRRNGERMPLGLADRRTLEESVLHIQRNTTHKTW